MPELRVRRSKRLRYAAEFGDKLREIRLASGLRRIDLIEGMGIRCGRLTTWEHGRTLPTRAYLEKIIAFLGYEEELRAAHAKAEHIRRNLPKLPTPWREVGLEVLAARKEFGLSQMNMALEIGTTQAFLSAMERGTLSPHEGVGFEICDYLGVEPKGPVRIDV